jgi:cellulose synthase/poly-beta-1,6-N-acetylglucosamine synthase-like glycosyltransferase
MLIQLAAAATAAAGVHPFVTYPLSLRLLPRRPLCHGAPPTSLAVCVCAYNEERVIAARVDNLLALRDDYPDIELLFYVDASTDRTAEILRSYGERIRLVVAGERHGKTHGMNRLVAMTHADIVVFSDANVIFAEDAVRRLVAPFADPQVGCVCGHLLYRDPADNAPDAATASTGSLYWRLEEHIKAGESATGSVMGADGSIFAIRRRLHVPPPDDLIDDMYVSLSILCAGYRIVRVADAYAFEESVSRPDEEFRRKIRIACQAFNVHRALRAPLATLSAVNRYKYVSHKLLRWLSVYLLATAWVLTLAGCAASGSGRLLPGFVGLSAVLGVALLSVRHGPVGKVRNIVAALLATGIGVGRSLQGQRFQTWSPPASARGPVAPAPPALAEHPSGS